LVLLLALVLASGGVGAAFPTLSLVAWALATASGSGSSQVSQLQRLFPSFISVFFTIVPSVLCSWSSLPSLSLPSPAG
jgi:hypothetical protein